MPLTGLSFLVVGSQPSLGRAGELLRRLGADVADVADLAGVADRIDANVRYAGAFVASGAGGVEGAAGAGAQLGGLKHLLGSSPVVVAEPDVPPAAAWALSGALALTGPAGGAPLAGPAAVPVRLKAAALVARLLAAVVGGRVEVDGPALLGERAAIAGLERQGRTSVGGASRLLPALDGWVAVTLARPSDFELLPAWLGGPASATQPWDDVARHVASHAVADVVDDAQLLGLPVAPAALPGSIDDRGPWHLTRFDARARRRRSARPLVVDLTSLWAGPLCSSLLAAAGARVIKVESRSRPDGARRGPPEFFDLLNAGKESVLLDLDTSQGLAHLRVLLEAADVVVESARPRVMHQWGIDVEALLAGTAEKTWVAITGYGRDPARARQVAFGDDAAAAGGLLALDDEGAPCFCADAAADPAAGLHAAVAALAGVVGAASRVGEGSYLVDVALSDVAASLATAAGPESVGRIRPSAGAAGWEIEVEGEVWPVASPRRRPPGGEGPPLGRDTDVVLAEFC